MTPTLTLRKHHGLGNDFLIAARPGRRPRPRRGRRPARSATATGASAPTG